MNILITGANRGLGRVLVDMAAAAGHTVFAGVRNIDSVSSQLQAMKDRYASQIYIIGMDVEDEQSVRDAFYKVSEQEAYLDVLINNAGIINGRERKIEEVDFQEFEQVLRINLMGPMMVVKHFLPLLRKSDNGVIINISSEAGSFANAYGGDYPYAISKAALNFFTAQIRNGLKDNGIKAYAVHPGWMRTDMGGASAPLSPEESAEGIMRIVNREIDLDEEHFFVDHLGRPMPM